MRIKRKLLYSSGCSLILLLLTISTMAQPYSGGSNGGSSVVNTSLINCTLSRSFGGDNSGSAVIASSLQQCTQSRFLGNEGAGSIGTIAQLTNCAVNRFFGDSAEGFTRATTDLLDCSEERFYGDSSSGAARSSSSLLDCTPARFFGDTGSGHRSVKLLVIRQFLGSDTSVTLICNSERYDLLGLYNAPGLSYNWNSATPTAAALGTYQLIATNAAGCVDTAMATLKQEIARWTGAISNNWHDAGNWSNGKIPDETTHAIIPGSTPNVCQISESDAVAASVQAFASGSFTIVNNRVLRITGTCISLPAGQ